MSSMGEGWTEDGVLTVGSGVLFTATGVVVGVSVIGCVFPLVGVFFVGVVTVGEAVDVGLVSAVFEAEQPAPARVRMSKKEGRMAFFIKENRLIVSCHRERCLANKLTTL